MPFASINGIELYYEVHGQGPALVFAHGGGGSHLSWWQQVPAFSDSFSVITFDHRSFGLSRDVPDGPGPEAFVQDLVALLDHLEVEKAVLAGQSMGGWTVGCFAAAHPSADQRPDPVRHPGRDRNRPDRPGPGRDSRTLARQLGRAAEERLFADVSPARAGADLPVPADCGPQHARRTQSGHGPVQPQGRPPADCRTPDSDPADRRRGGCPDPTAGHAECRRPAAARPVHHRPRLWPLGVFRAGRRVQPHRRPGFLREQMSA